MDGVTQEPAMTSNLSDVARLLDHVFKLPKYNGTEYLDWLYHRDPAGTDVSVDYFEANTCKAHYAVVPAPYHSAFKKLPFSLSLNTAVAPDLRLKGLFSRLAEDCYAKAAERGIAAVTGVANANSTPGFTKRLGFTLVGPLPVKIGIAGMRRHNGFFRSEMTTGQSGEEVRDNGMKC